ncbi:MAG: glycoside hydrolase family 97 catalytic domain-containing protein [bacterium]
MNRILTAAFILVISSFTSAQNVVVDSPNKKINIALYNQGNNDFGKWYLKINYKESNKNCEVIPQINLGLSRSDLDFCDKLQFIKAVKPLLIKEQYSALHGKRAQCNNSANEIVVTFENPGKIKLNLIIRAYNDGAAFRYEFPEKSGSFLIKDELTSYTIPEGAKRWMEKWDLGNEALYTFIKDENVQQSWSYPALFNSPDSTCWYLIHEADVNRNYCASKLSNVENKSGYKITFPDPGDGEGESQPTIRLPWKSPWRVIIIGSLADIVESTLVDDVSPPSVITKTDWIKPGKASWNYWSNNHGTKDYKTVCEFADLAAAMDWPYTLLDWEWDQMGNGGNLEDALKYIISIGVKPLMWYNSGAFKWVQTTPRDRMLTHENRIKEFAKLKKLGVVGVKIDFFLSEKQEMIKYYLDILDDAAQYEMMVYFHGCLVPRGWSRTYPHLMTYEGIRGAEWYNNGPEFTTTAPEHNTTIPFTRNVVGAMDYTPVTFTNSQFPHITSYGHELAQSVVFESGIQHMADRPAGYYELPDAARTFLKEVPNAWDDTKLIDGYPGKDVFIARRKNNTWYIGGLNSEKIEKNKTLKFDFLTDDVKYKLTLIADGKHDEDFSTSYLVVDKFSSVSVKMLRRGGFAALLKPIE